MRIRTPHPHDVLSGRGGGINSHEGNKTFRGWVQERKERYNLAASKADKTEVANEVIDLVRSLNPPGRFLQKDTASTSGVSYWIELDEVKVMAKTSQALREGAPQIRAAHKDELAANRKKKRRRKASSASKQSKAPRAKRGTSDEAPVATTETTYNSMPAPIHGAPSLSSIMFSNSPGKTLPVALNPNAISDGADASNSSAPRTQTRTDKAIESMKQNVLEAQSLAEREAISGSSSSNYMVQAPLSPAEDFSYALDTPTSAYGRQIKRVRHDPSSNFELPTPPLTSVPHPPYPLKYHSSSSSTGLNGLTRAHSLAMSDFSDFSLKDGQQSSQEEFVNPFENESDLIPPLPSPPRLRNLSSSDQESGKKRSSTNRYVEQMYFYDKEEDDNDGHGARHRDATPTSTLDFFSLNKNGPICFCDCGKQLQEGESCMCGELADHLLHRSDGLSLMHLSSSSSSLGKNGHQSTNHLIF